MRFLLPFILALCLWSSSVLADGNPIPSTDYPSQTRITLISPVDNQTWDCAWAIDCTMGTVLFHSGTGDILGRTGGWTQIGTWRHHRSAFIVTMNRFDSVHDAAASVADMASTVTPSWNVGIKVWQAKPFGAGSWQGTMHYAGFSLYLLAVALPNGDDIEAGVSSPNKWAHTVNPLLRQQVKDAIAASCEEDSGC